MSESNQPFTDLATKKRGGAQASSLGWVTAILMAVVAGVIFFLGSAGKARQNQALESLRSKLEESSTNLSQALAENQTNQDLITALKARVGELEQDKAATVQKASSLEDQMRAELESKDVTISKLQGKLTVNILDRVLFDSGEAVLKPEGAAVIKKIAGLLAGHPEVRIHVIGHTDNVPIRPGAQGRFASNWELSTARALAAVHFLVEQGGIDPRRVGAVGYGEFRPIADNATAEGRARNRRIAITILPDELAGDDTAPTAKPAAATNAPTASSATP